MDTPNTGSTLVKDNEFPFYTQEEENITPVWDYRQVPSGPGSKLDADTTDGINAVTASVAGPNKLVATYSDGKLPMSILPTSISGGVINTVVLTSFMIGTLAYLKANSPAGPAFGLATDVGSAGALYMYFNNISVGDGGWVFITGS